ncbi:hypothetical protein RHSP_27296 [Rhizobium freirei PRF 81]|uniref:Uncharacterized protein n=1 Tax=Rhizobium freirei PRF 81 TaxID=363754 RepID=N6V2R8_9HYPH|nr:hypothetical protein RHSP_27296 [Rhizobium freirei PRF 81]
MHDADRPTCIVDDYQRRDIVTIEHGHGARRQRRFLHRLRVTGHHLVHAHIGKAGAEIAGDIAIGDDAAQAAVIIDHTDTAETHFRQRHRRFRHAGAKANQGHAVTLMHDVGDMRKAGAELAAGMEGTEIFGREAACLEQSHGQRIADGQLQQRRCRRGQSVGTGFLLLGQQQYHVRLAGERRGLACGDGDHRDREAAGITDDAAQLRAFATPGYGDDDVVLRDHAEIAVIGLDRMDEESRRARGGQTCGKLVADMAALADTGDNDAAADVADDLHRAAEGLGQTVAQRAFQRLHAPSFGLDRSHGGFDRTVLDEFYSSLIHEGGLTLFHKSVHRRSVSANSRGALLYPDNITAAILTTAP